MSTAVGIAIWLLIGYVFTVWFVNFFLENKRWGDTGEEPGPVTLVLMTIVGPGMAAIMAFAFLVDFLANNFSEAVKRLFLMRMD